MLTNDQVRPTLGIPAIGPTPEMAWYKDGRILFLGEARGESYLMETSATGRGNEESCRGWHDVSILGIGRRRQQGSHCR